MGGLQSYEHQERKGEWGSVLKCARCDYGNPAKGGGRHHLFRARCEIGDHTALVCLTDHQRLPRLANSTYMAIEEFPQSYRTLSKSSPGIRYGKICVKRTMELLKPIDLAMLP